MRSLSHRCVGDVELRKDFSAHGGTYVPASARRVGSCSMGTFYLSVEIGR